jgi:hypothetical protein
MIQVFVQTKKLHQEWQLRIVASCPKALSLQPIGAILAEVFFFYFPRGAHLRLVLVVEIDVAALGAASKTAPRPATAYRMHV